MSRTGKDKYTYISHQGKHSRYMRKHPRANIPEDLMHTSMKDRRFGEYEYSWGRGMNWEYTKRYLRKNIGRGYNNVLEELYAKLKEAKVDEQTFNDYKLHLNPSYEYAIVGRETPNSQRSHYRYQDFYVDERGILRASAGWRDNVHIPYKKDPNNSARNLYYVEDTKSFNKKKEYNEKNLNLPEMLRESIITRELGRVWIINDSGKSEMRDVILVRSAYEVSGWQHAKYKEMTSQDREYLDRNYEPTFVIGLGESKVYKYNPPTPPDISSELRSLYDKPSTFTYRFYAKKK